VIRLRSDLPALAAIGLLLGLLVASARLIAVQRLGGGAVAIVEPAIATGAVVFAVLTVTCWVRRSALGLVAPALGLAVIGDVIAFRLRVAGDPSVPPNATVTTLIAVGLFIAVVVCVRDLSRLERAAWPAAALGLALVLAPLVPGLGVARGGARAWIDLPGGPLVAPGEIGRPLLMLGVAALLARYGPMLSALARDRPRGAVGSAIAAVTAIPLAAVLVLLLENDMGPAAILLVALGGAMTLATGQRRFVMVCGAALGVAMVSGYLISGRLQGRILDVIDPMRDQGGLGQAGIARLGSAWGGWDGTGLGGGLAARPGAIPAQSTDYALSLWTQEMGLVGLAVVLALLARLLTGAWRAAREGRVGFETNAAIGLAALLTVQTLWISAAILGFAPLTGVVTPLVSGGGSARAGMALIVALLVCAQPAVQASPAMPARPELRLDAAATRRLRIASTAAICCLVMIAIAGSITLSRSAEGYSRRGDNPFRLWSTLDRGLLVSSDGRLLAWTTGAASLDRVVRHRRGMRSINRLVGRAAGLRGDTGIEASWNALLRCAGSGQARLPKSLGGEVSQVVGNPADCDPASLRLTVDVRLQRAARRALGDRYGAVAVVEASSGAVLAAHGRTPARGEDGAAVDLAVAPGSTFKPITAVAALEAGVDVMTPLARGYRPVGGPWLGNAGGGWCGGGLTVAFATSCNSSFARLAARAGPSRLLSTAARFGLAPGPRMAVSGVDVSAGSVLGDTDPRSVDETLLASSAIGQGRVTATPLQMALVYSALANRGLRPRPHLVSAACIDGEPADVHVPRRVRASSPRAAAVVEHGLRRAVTAGTALRLNDAPGRFAAKTGTAELPRLEEAGTPAGTAGWIVGYPTADTSGEGRRRPVVAVLVLPDRAARHRTGSADAAGVLERMARPVERWRPAADGCAISRDAFAFADRGR
jgi:cell division protein FtsW (lipid II flippase)